MFLSKRQNGFYYLIFTDEITGKRKMISCRTRYKPEALKFLTQFKNNSRKLHKEKSYVVHYTEDLKREVLKYTSDNLQNSTVQIYNRVLNDMLRIIKNKPVKFILNSDIENYKSIRIREVKNTTVNIDLKTMRAIFNLALKWSWINENPMKYVKLLLIPQKERLCFNENELKILINNISNPTLKNIVLFGLYTGCRLNEIVNVQWKDICFKDNIILIRNKENFKTKTGKNRKIPISEHLKNLLREKTSINDNIFDLYEPDNYVFVNEKKIKCNKNLISRRFKETLRKINFPDKYHFHCLRHTFITNLIKSGVNINFVKELAGHSEIQTTMNYIHLVTEDLREAVNKISIT